MTIKLGLCAVAIFTCVVALWAVLRQEGEKSFDSSEARGSVTKAHLCVGLAVSVVLTLLFSVGIFGVVKEKLCLIKFCILLLSLSILGDVALFIFAIIAGVTGVTATPFFLLFCFDVFCSRQQTYFVNK